MANLSQLTIPVKDTITGQITNQTFDLPSGGGSSTPEAIGFGYGTCSTAYITTEKAVSLSNYVLTVNGIIAVYFANAVPAAATLNVNNKGAKPIFHKGAALTGNIILAGDTATFIYDGTYYHLIALDRTLAKATNVTIGSASAGTNIAADDITSWNAGTAASASVSGTKLTINNGTAPSLSYTSRSIPNISVTNKSVTTEVK